MTENKRFECNENKVIDNCTNGVTECKNLNEAYLLCNFLNKQDKTIEKQKLIIAENEQLKKGMIGVVDRYIKNVECNPPSSARTYIKIKGALNNIREDLRNLIGDLE